MAMTIWHIEQKVVKLQNPILIEGLPGIGNVGKIAVDFLIDELKAKKIATLHASNFPHTVFVNEDNLVDLPTIEFWLAKAKRDIILLSGDFQPSDEESSHEFCFKVLELLQSMKCKEMVTLGGIGLQQVPENPRVFCTANSKTIIKQWQKAKLNNQIYGVVGPIVGVTGLLVGLASRYGIEAIALLGETFGHPMYVGVKGSKAILTALKDHLGIKIDLKKLDKAILESEQEIKRSGELQNISRQTAMNKLKEKIDTDQRYIG